MMPQHTTKQANELQQEAVQREAPQKEVAQQTPGAEDSIPNFTEFTQTTTFHGVRYIFVGAFKLRKWV